MPFGVRLETVQLKINNMTSLSTQIRAYILKYTTDGNNPSLNIIMAVLIYPGNIIIDYLVTFSGKGPFYRKMYKE